jgi:hypothetical protein
MWHRNQHYYSVRDSNGDLLFTVFTTVKACTFSARHPEQMVVIGKVCTYISRYSAADMIRQARQHPYEITRHISEYDTAAFCDTYCQRP